jgi:hypothetical protein
LSFKKGDDTIFFKGESFMPNTKGDEALNCLLSLNKLDETQYSDIIKNDVGAEIIGVFEKYCRGIAPQGDANVLNTLVHLMITGYLIKASEIGPLAGQSKIVTP